MNFENPEGTIKLLSKGMKGNKSLFLCYCGNTFESRYDHVKRGETKSCGCLVSNGLDWWDYKCGKASSHPLYVKWRGILNRCGNDKYPAYLNVKVCPDWKKDFRKFFEWSTKSGWKPQMEIDRRDPLGDYSPDNCRYITREENQSRMIEWHKKRGTGINTSTSKEKSSARAKKDQGKPIRLFDEINNEYHTFNTIGEGANFIKHKRKLDTLTIRIKSNLSACCLGKRKRCHNFTAEFIGK